MNLAADLALRIPDYPDFVAAGVAAGIAVAAWLIAFFLGRKLGPYLAGLWERHAGSRRQGIAARMCDLARELIAAVLLAVALKAYPWPPLSAFVLGLPLAVAITLFIIGIVRGLHLPRWIALLLGGVAFVAVLAEALGGLTPITDTLDQVGFTAGRSRFSLLTILQIVVALLVLYVVLRLASRVINKSIERATALDATQQLLTQKLAGVALLVIAFFVGIDIIGVDLTALAVFSGAFGLAVGFGFQKTFGNLIAGIILLMDRSIKPGDVIAVGESFGHVTKIGVRAVSIVTRDGKEHLIPNENLMTQEVENWSYSSPNVRVHISVGVAYDCDLALAQKLMIEAAMTPKRVLKMPKPTVWLRAFGESSVDHDILLWIADPEAGVGNIQSEVLNRLWVLFKENGIAIPFPQRDVHVKEWPAEAGHPKQAEPPPPQRD
jgi:small-conductance mechanosensitive channel